MLSCIYWLRSLFKSQRYGLKMELKDRDTYTSFEYVENHAASLPRQLNTVQKQ